MSKTFVTVRGNRIISVQHGPDGPLPEALPGYRNIGVPKDWMGQLLIEPLRVYELLEQGNRPQIIKGRLLPKPLDT